MLLLQRAVATARRPKTAQHVFYPGITDEGILVSRIHLASPSLQALHLRLQPVHLHLPALALRLRLLDLLLQALDLPLDEVEAAGDGHDGFAALLLQEHGPN